MSNYDKVMLGKGSSHAAEDYQDGFIGVDYEIPQAWSGT